MGKQKSDRKSRFCQDVIPKHNRMSNQNTNKIVQLFWWPFGGPSKSLAELYERRVVNFSVIERWSISYLLCHLHVHFQEELILKSWSPVLQLTAFQVERQVYGNMWHQFACMQTWSEALLIHFPSADPTTLAQNFTLFPRICFLHHITGATVCTSYTWLGGSSNLTTLHLLTLLAGTASFNSFCLGVISHCISKVSHHNHPTVY